MGETDRPELEILPNPLVKLMPLVLGMIAIVWGLMASLIPGIPVLGRIAAFAAIIGTISYLYLTMVRRLVVGDDSVEIELTRKTARIPYSNLDLVTVRANHLGGALRLKLVLKAPPAAIRCRIALTSDEVLKITPRLIRALIIHGVEVRVPDPSGNGLIVARLSARSGSIESQPRELDDSLNPLAIESFIPPQATPTRGDRCRYCRDKRTNSTRPQPRSS
jgi:hypothetical protein